MFRLHVFVDNASHTNLSLPTRMALQCVSVEDLISHAAFMAAMPYAMAGCVLDRDLESFNRAATVPLCLASCYYQVRMQSKGNSHSKSALWFTSVHSRVCCQQCRHLRLGLGGAGFVAEPYIAVWIEMRHIGVGTCTFRKVDMYRNPSGCESAMTVILTCSKSEPVSWSRCSRVFTRNFTSGTVWTLSYAQILVTATNYWYCYEFLLVS